MARNSALVLLALFALARESNADVGTFERLLLSSGSPAETAIMCAPMYHRFAGAVELALAEAVMQNKSPDEVRGLANSFFQNRYRWIALKEAAHGRGLEALLDRAYRETAGIGTHEFKRFREECVIGVNHFIHDTTEMEPILDNAIEAARTDLSIIVQGF